MDLKNAQMGYLRLRLKSAGDVELELDENFDEIINMMVYSKIFS